MLYYNFTDLFFLSLTSLFLLVLLLILCLGPIQIITPTVASHLPLFAPIMSFWHLAHYLYCNCLCICLIFDFVGTWRAEAESDSLLCIQCWLGTELVLKNIFVSMCCRISRNLKILSYVQTISQDDTNKLVYFFRLVKEINFP